MTVLNVNEVSRLAEVKRFLRYDFDLNHNLQGILKLATNIYETPVAFITLLDEQIQWFKATRGFEVEQMPRETSFCTHTIMKDEVMVVSDATKDDRFANIPLVKYQPNIRFYAGAPLCSNSGMNIGTLCVMDTESKEIPEDKQLLLDILAKQAIYLMELDLTYKMLQEKIVQIEHQNTVLTDIAFIQSHEFRGPLSTIMGLMNAIKDDDYVSPKDYLIMMEEAIGKLDEKIHIVVKSTDTIRKAYIA